MSRTFRTSLTVVAILVALVLLISWTLQVALAATITVNSTADNVTAGDGLCTLREAIANANSDTDTTSGDCVGGNGADIIELGAGTYSLTAGALTITDNLSIAGGSGVFVSGDGGTTLFDVQGVNFTITNVSLLNGVPGIENTGGTVTANYNRFFGNTPAIRNNSGTVNAENNWWGCDGFPGTTGCDDVEGTVDADPRIDMRLRANPTTIENLGDTYDLVADFTLNSAGTDISTPMSVLDGLTVTFTSGNSAVPGSQAVPIFFDRAYWSYNFDTATPDPREPTATLDNGTDSAFVYFGDPAPKGSITINKATEPAGGTNFGFTTNIGGNKNFVLDDSGSLTISDLTSSNYVISEDALTGWELADLTCDSTNVEIDVENREVTIGLAAGENVSCIFTNRQLATVTIQKATDPTGGTGFTFTSTLPDYETFDLDDNGSITAEGVSAGTYSVLETALPTGWQLSSIDCGEASTTPLNDGVEINVGAGDNITCTFNNVQPGSLTIDKETDPSPDPYTQSFDFAVTGPDSYSDSTSLTDAATPTNFASLTPGTYTITETAVAGWDLSGVTCGGTPLTPTNGVVSVSVGAGEDVLCTFTNTIQRGTLVIDKVTDPAGDTTSFSFDIDGGPDSFSDSVSLTDTTDPVSVTNLLPGTYTITETAVAGWDLTSATCDDGSNPASIDLAAGETVTCTFTNTLQRGTIVIDKVTDPSPDPTDPDQSFDFTVTGPDSFSDNVSLTDTTDPVSVANLLPGTYTIAETLVSGWELSSVTCDGAPVTPTDGAITVEIGPGETASCTFTNTKLGSLTIEKVTNPSPDPTDPDQGFTFTVTGPSGTLGTPTLSNGQSETFSNLPAGTYDISETAVSGWELTDITCDGIQLEPVGGVFSLSLGTGEDVTCTATNTKYASLTVQKVTDPSPDPTDPDQGFGFTVTGPSGALGTPTLTNGQSETFSQLDGGQYTIAETLVDGWELASVVCDNTELTPVNGSVDLTVGTGEDVTCIFTNVKLGSLTINKITDPSPDPTSQSFTFNVTGPDSFSDSTVLANGASDDFLNLQPGTYTVSEGAVTGWGLTSFTCGGTPVTPTNGSFDVTISGGEDVSCNVTNTLLGTIVVEKVTDPSPDPTSQSFGFSITGPDSFSDSTSLTDSTSDSFTELVPGTYNLSEDTLPGWDLTSATCDDGSPPGNIALAAGETVTCTFTNTLQRGSITVQKVTDPSPDPTSQSFGFSITGPNNYSGSASLTNGGSDSFTNLVPGTYNLSEDTVAGWDLTSATCDDGSEPSSIALAAGENVTCTFTNTLQRGSITVQKVTDPSPDPTSQSFGFSITGPNNYSGSASLTDGTSDSFTELVPGTYNLSEDTVPGWDLTSATCSDGSDPGSISLEVGEDVTCTFTNTIQRGTIVVEKVTNPSPDLSNQSFGFTVTGPNNYSGSASLTDGTSDSFTELVPGTYSLSEDAVNGWELTSATCSDGSDPASINLGAGETVTCTFTNTEVGSITIEKVTVPASDTTTAFAFSIDGPDAYSDSDSLTNGQNRTFSGLLPGNYTVTEGVEVGWGLTGVTCDGSPVTPTNGTINLSLSAGQDISCTFTNEQQFGTIIIEKSATPADGTVFDFTSDVPGGGSFSLADGSATVSNTITFADVPVGTYTVSETAVLGWELTGIDCGAEGTFTGNPATISLQDNETVTCTFTNEQGVGTIIVQKNADPADGTVFDFTSDVPGGESFSLADGSATVSDTVTFANVPVGTFNISETPVDGWALTGIDCGTAGTFTGNPATIMLGVNETITCTFSNQQSGSLTVTKQVVWNDITPDTSQTFTICVQGPSYPTPDCQQADWDGGDLLWAGLVPGTYTVSETSPGAEWDVSITPSATVVVAAGGAAAVTVTNTNTGVSVYRTYLPFIIKEPAQVQLPDLVVSELSIIPAQAAYTTSDDVTIKVTVTNTGQTPTASGFWVDLYINPNPVPTHANLPLPWYDTTPQPICSTCFGISWSVEQALAPGESIELFSTSASYEEAFTYWLGWLPAGTHNLYAYADTFNVDNLPGVIDEIDENNNRAEILGVQVTGENRPTSGTTLNRLLRGGEFPQRPMPRLAPREGE